MERATILRSEEDIFLLRRTLYCGQSTYLVKMRMNIGFLVGTFGVLFLPHAAYYTIQYKALLKITQEEFSGPPFDVVIKLIIGLLLCMWAALTVPGKFLSIHPQSDENRLVIKMLKSEEKIIVMNQKFNKVKVRDEL
ncbi:unnamed protein product [Cuscuta europaea]|uniref:Membrane magnesium transporter n=1 Tax=Cuscuta europaea TaxID=41803 RepID=A0A9P1EN01_CUSEU|nr:unnamed protein product [Cuscuta europaea]